MCLAASRRCHHHLHLKGQRGGGNQCACQSQANLTKGLHSSTAPTVSRSSMVCSHGIAQTYACLLLVIIQWACHSAALSGCCAPMLPLRGCRVSMRALGCRWTWRLSAPGVGGGRSITHSPQQGHRDIQYYTRSAQPTRRRESFFSSCSSDVAVKHIHIIARATHYTGVEGDQLAFLDKWLLVTGVP